MPSKTFPPCHWKLEAKCFARRHETSWGCLLLVLFWSRRPRRPRIRRIRVSTFICHTMQLEKSANLVFHAHIWLNKIENNDIAEMCFIKYIQDWRPENMPKHVLAVVTLGHYKRHYCDFSTEILRNYRNSVFMVLWRHEDTAIKSYKMSQSWCSDVLTSWKFHNVNGRDLKTFWEHPLDFSHCLHLCHQYLKNDIKIHIIKKCLKLKTFWVCHTADFSSLPIAILLFYHSLRWLAWLI